MLTPEGCQLKNVRLVRILAYSYSDPLIGNTPDQTIWGWEVDRVYWDLGARQQLEQLLKDCQSVYATESSVYLLVRCLEELGDSVQAVNDCLLCLAELNVQLILVEAHGLRQGQPNQKQNAAIPRIDLIQFFSELQQRQRSRQITQGHAQNRIKALPPPGKAPYGYRRGKDRYAVDRSAANIVKDFFERFLIYGSLRGAVRYLEERHGKKISVTTGRRWLLNPAYRGDLAYKTGEVISNTHVPIISREEAAQVDRLLQRNQRMSPRSASAPRSLSGLVVCGECQCLMTITRVTAHRKATEYLYLRPTACPKQPKCRGINYEEILTATIQNICQDLPRAVANLALPSLGQAKTAIQQEIIRKQAILEQLPGLIETEILDQATADLRAYTLRAEIAELQKKIAQLPPVNLKETAQAVSLPEFWLDLTETERRFYFREFIRQIELIRQQDHWYLKLQLYL
ncbi:MAG: recombinase family protein [Microcoleaceae cyanobacterium]